MNIIIIEDEKPAAQKLQKAILRADSTINIETALGTVQDAVNWLQQHRPPDLIFMDIELTDGLSFQIMDKVVISCPIIFITAFDEYWQEAFEHNGIDYLLKPVKQEKLEAALQKFKKFQSFFTVNFQPLQQWHGQAPNTHYKKRFLVKRGMDYITVKTEEIAYFYASHKLVCMIDNNGQKFILDKSLSELEKEIDAAQFYRLNRKYLANVQAIKRIKTCAKGKLLIELWPRVEEEIVISQENAGSFKDWVGT